MTGGDVAVTAVGAYACGYALLSIARAGLSTRWPSTDGEIAQARLVAGRDTDDGPHEYVAYRYSVGGRPFRNDRVRFGLPVVGPSSRIPGVDPPADFPSQAAALAAEYPIRRRVLVYYDPRRPENSVLYRSPHWGVWLMLAVGGLFLYLGLRGAR